MSNFDMQRNWVLNTKCQQSWKWSLAFPQPCGMVCVSCLYCICIVFVRCLPGVCKAFVLYLHCIYFIFIPCIVVRWMNDHESQQSWFNRFPGDGVRNRELSTKCQHSRKCYFDVPCICFVFVWNSVLYFIMFRLDFLRYGVRNRELAQGANILDRWIYPVGCWFDLFVCSLFCLYVFSCVFVCFLDSCATFSLHFRGDRERNRELA